MIITLFYVCLHSVNSINTFTLMKLIVIFWFKSSSTFKEILRGLNKLDRKKMNINYLIILLKILKKQMILPVKDIHHKH